MEDKDDKTKTKGNVLFFKVEPSVITPLTDNFPDFGIEFSTSDDHGEALKRISKNNIDS